MQNYTLCKVRFDCFVIFSFGSMNFCDIIYINISIVTGGVFNGKSLQAHKRTAKTSK